MRILFVCMGSRRDVAISRGKVGVLSNPVKSLRYTGPLNCDE